MGELSEWLKIMLGEISRKQDEAVRAQREQQQRTDSAAATPPVPDPAHAPRATH